MSGGLEPPDGLATERPIAIALVAMGGQGGGVVSDWLIALAQSQGFIVQATSVPGVAQRTGATIYYVEIARPHADGRAPVLSLMPTPGDVDIVLAAEFMEAGRSMLRGLVTPERTTLVASTHRSFATAEKQVPGDGIADAEAVVAAAGVAAKRIVAFDLQDVADRNGSVISAALFGALAGADVLPFPRDAFEDAIKAGGKGVGPSLKAFSAAYEHAKNGPTAEARTVVVPSVLPAATGIAELDALVARIRDGFPAATHPLLIAGVRHLVDYQDAAYAGHYLDRMAQLRDLDAQTCGDAPDHALTRQAAKYLAKALAFDDVIRVADLKTRGTRAQRVGREVGLRDGEILYTTEFMHPRMEEVVGTLPLRLGAWIEARPVLMRALDRIVNRGRRVQTGTLLWFLPLYLLAGYKTHRRGTLRYAREIAHIDVWLDLVTRTAKRDYPLAVETLACRRLVKGYSDTHARGQSKFDRVTAAVSALTGRPDSAAWLRRLLQAALADEEGTALAGALLTLETAYA